MDKDGKSVIFDDSQFMNQTALDQKKLFVEIQKVTNPNSNKNAKFNLDKLNSRINDLFKDIWNEMRNQNMNGEDNNLFECNDHHFTEMDKIAKDLDGGVKEIMEELKLNTAINTKENSSICRDRLVAGKGFKLFNSLPTPTKLRYFRGNVIKKGRQVKALRRRMKRSLFSEDPKLEKKIQISQLLLFNKYTSDFDSIELQLDNLVTKGTFTKNAKDIHSEIIKEEEMWEKHIEAINHFKEDSELKNKIDDVQKGNAFHFEDAKIIPKINRAMRDSECNQAFPESSSSKTDFEFLTKESDNWTDDIIRGRELISWIKENGFDEFLAEMAYDHLGKAIKFLEKMEKKIN